MSTLDILKRIVRSQGAGIGEPVTNLYGAVGEEGIELLAAQDAHWLALMLPGTSFMGPDEFYAVFATGDSPSDNVFDVKANRGTVVLSSAEPVTFLLRGVTDVAGALTIPVAIALGATQGEWAFYVNGTLQRRGSGDRSFTLSFGKGRHLIEIVVAASAFGIQFPESFRVSAVRDVLTAPLWASVEPGYVDPASGQPAVRLSWYNNPRVGGWSLSRRELTNVQPIYKVTQANDQGQFSVIVPQDVTDVVNIGNSVYAGLEEMGLVIEASYDALGTVTYEAEEFIGITSLLCRLPGDRHEINQFWLGRTLMTGVFRELARVQRTGHDTIVSYTDAAVVYGNPYEYFLQAYGLFDASMLGPKSEVRYVRAGDTEAPGPIVIDPLYPQVINHRANVLFDTPIDQDYAGVRVFFEDVAFEGAPSSATPTTLTIPGTYTADLTGYVITVLSGPCINQERLVGSNVGGVLTLGDEDMWYDDGVTGPVPTTGSVVRVSTRLPILTDYGAPNTGDQLSFEVVKDELGDPIYGNYFFASFDLAGNIQDAQDMVAWEYTEDDDDFLGQNQPPDVSIIQLRPEQQAVFAAPYNNATNYAVVELNANDPVDDTTGVVIEYRTRKITSGTSSGTNSADTMNDLAATWGSNEHVNYLVDIVGGTGVGQSRAIISNVANQLVIATDWDTIPDATSVYEITWTTGLTAGLALVAGTLDSTTGTRSRYLAIDKTETANWLTVRAYDQDGLYAMPVTYAPDFDHLPEISSLNSRLDIINDRIYITGSVDDDCRSFRWWLENADDDEPTFATPNELYRDTSAEKTFPVDLTGESSDIPFDFRLDDGQRKTLVIEPWTQIDFAGESGTLVKREFTRSPRTSLVLENKDSVGDTSADTIKASFFPTPEIPIVEGGPGLTRTLTAVTAPTATDEPTLTDGTRSWTVDEFEPLPDTYQVFYVRVLNPDTGVEQFSKIISNTATTLTLEGWFDSTYGIPAAGWEYEIRAGATFQRSSLTPGGGTFRGVYDPIFLERDPDDTIYLQYYTVLSGVPAEEINTAPIDSDTLPSILAVTASEAFSPYQLYVRIIGPDDDTKSWIAYVRKGNWPVRGGVQVSASQETIEQENLDPSFVKWDGLLTTSDDFTFDAGAGTWHVIACPVNGINQAGPCRLATAVVDGTVSSAGIQNLTGVNFDEDPGVDGLGVDGADAYQLLSWQINELLASPSTSHTVKIYAYRSDQGVASEVLVVDSRYPWQDSTSGNPPVGLYSQSRSADIDEAGSNGSYDYDTIGSYLRLMPMKRGRPETTGSPYTYVYRAELWNGGTQIADLGPKSVPGYFQRPIPVFDDDRPATIAVTKFGACSLVPDEKGNYGASPSLTQVIRWYLEPETVNPTDYYFQLEVAETATPIEADYHYIARPWPVASTDIGSFAAPWYGWVQDGGSGNLLNVHTHYWTWRIHIVRDEDDTIISTTYTPTMTMTIGECPNEAP